MCVVLLAATSANSSFDVNLYLSQEVVQITYQAQANVHKVGYLGLLVATLGQALLQRLHGAVEVAPAGIQLLQCQ